MIREILGDVPYSFSEPEFFEALAPKLVLLQQQAAEVPDLRKEIAALRMGDEEVAELRRCVKAMRTEEASMLAVLNHATTQCKEMERQVEYLKVKNSSLEDSTKAQATLLEAAEKEQGRLSYLVQSLSQERADLSKQLKERGAELKAATLNSVAEPFPRYARVLVEMRRTF